MRRDRACHIFMGNIRFGIIFILDSFKARLADSRIDKILFVNVSFQNISERFSFVKGHRFWKSEVHIVQEAHYKNPLPFLRNAIVERVQHGLIHRISKTLQMRFYDSICVSAVMRLEILDILKHKSRRTLFS